MQTKQQIRQLLASAGVSPNKRLGQHYLIDLNLMRLLVDTADIRSNDIVLEVGCGTGSLTEAIAEKAAFCLAVEVDKNMAQIASRQLAGTKNVKVINADILETKNTLNRTITTALQRSRKKYTGRALLVANLPYNVASSVMANLITGPTTVDSMFVTVQKQVAERMTASAGGGEYGTMSILLSATGDARIIRVLKPTVFWPQPQVDSAMVGFERKEDKVKRIKNMKLFSDIVNLFMGHRRKMLKACTRFAQGRLAKITNWQATFKSASIEASNRAEQLRPQDYIAIANLCNEQLEKNED